MATNNAINQIGKLPAFYVHNTNDLTNLTGDSTKFIMTYPTIIYDTTSSFDGTSTFTAPLTGKYYLEVSIYITNLDAAMNNGFIAYKINGQPETFIPYYSNMGAIRNAANNIQVTVGTVYQLTASNTVQVTLQISGSTKTVGIQGSVTSGCPSNHFCGYMISGI